MARMNWNRLICDKRFGQEDRHDSKGGVRSDFERDYDRLVFSSPFRRLQNKTQVFPLPGSIFVHNRLTHSLEVSSVGKSLAGEIALRLKDKYAGEPWVERLRDISGVSDVYLKSKRNSAEFISFLYSLDSNPRMQGRGVSFSEELRANQELRVVLLLFYAAEVYYAAQLLKMKGLKTPAYITVSGTASKVLGLIGNIDALQTLATHIFNDVLGDDGKVELKQVENPKEITCKGGLNMKQRFVVDDVEAITKFRTGSTTLDQLSLPRYKDVTDAVRDEVLAGYRTFVDYFFSLSQKYSFAKYFGVSNEREFSLFRTILTEKAEQDFNKAIEARRDSMTDEENPELKDSLFFIPLTGGISRLALHIAQNP